MARKDARKDTGKKVAIGAGIAGILVALLCFLTKRGQPVEGDTQCLGFDLYEYKNEQWVLIEANSTACGWQPGEAEFQLSDLIIEPSTVNVGEPVTIGVTVANIGEKSGTKTVALEVI